ncbi:MAG: hypothetical protein RLZZ306_902 [Bacteroidota bacterium]|jgi:hypothetical protein
MFEDKDYSKLTLEELIIEEKATKKKVTTFQVIAGIAVGVTLYAIFKRSVSFIHVALPLVSSFILRKNGENLKMIQKEIQNKNP